MSPAESRHERSLFFILSSCARGTSETPPADARVWVGLAAETHFPCTAQHGPVAQFWVFFSKQHPLRSDAQSVPSGTTARRILEAFSEPPFSFAALSGSSLTYIPRDLGIEKLCITRVSLPTSTVRQKSRNNKIMSN